MKIYTDSAESLGFSLSINSGLVGGLSQAKTIVYYPLIFKHFQKMEIAVVRFLFLMIFKISVLF